MEKTGGVKDKKKYNVTHLITLYTCNRNVTLKMAGLLAETCR